METPRNVMVVADLESDAMALSDALQASGAIQPTVVIGSHDLVRQYLQLRPEAVVLDLFTDPRAGADLISQLSNVGWSGVPVPFFVISDDLNSSHTREAVVAGVRAPVLRERVEKELSTLLATEVDARRRAVEAAAEDATPSRVVHLNGPRQLAVAN